MSLIGMRAIFSLITAILILWGCPAVSPQSRAETVCNTTAIDLRFERISVDQGLSSNSVFSIVQDNKGFLWMATGIGLARYDGIEFQNSFSIPGDENSLSGNLTNVVYEDSKDQIWVGTDGEGLNRLLDSNGNFTRFKNNPDTSNSLADNRVRDITEDDYGYLWIATAGGVSKINLDNQNISSYKNDLDDAHSLSDNDVWSVYKDSRGSIWIGTTKGLNIYRPDTDDFLRYQYCQDRPGSISSDTIFAMYEDRGGRFWVGTYLGGLNLMDRETGWFTTYQSIPGNPYSLSNNAVWSIHEDKQGNFWVGTAGGLHTMDRQDGTFTRIQNDTGNQFSLSHNIVRSIYEDNTGIIWIGTNGGGLNKLDFNKQIFKLYQHNPGNLNSLSHNQIHSVIESESGGIYAGTANGFNFIDLNNGKVIRNEVEGGNSISLIHEVVRSLFQSEDGTLWIGSFGGLQSFNFLTGVSNIYVNDPINPLSLSHNPVSSLCEDTSGKLWVGTFLGGLNLLDIDTGLFKRYRHDSQDQNSISSDGIRKVFKDKNGVIWIATTQGLNRYNTVSDDFTRFLHEKENPHSLVNNHIYSIYEDSRGLLWIGTNGGGLNVLDRNTGIFTHVTDTRLSSNIIFSIIEDDQGCLWLGTNTGLVCFNPDTLKAILFDKDKGLPANQFEMNAVHKKSDGTLLFGNRDGLVAFCPEELKLSKYIYIPPVVITNFTVSNQTGNLIKYQPIVDGNNARYILDYTHSSLTLSFVALDFAAPMKNQYAYMLEGFDKNWHSTTAENRQAVYTNLGSGDYVFRVKASNSDGLWNEIGASLYVTITPPFWQTWWFITLMILGAIGTIYSGYRWRLAAMASRQRFLESQIKARTVELEGLYQKEYDLHQRLEKQVKDQVEYTRALVHELKTPITTLKAASELLSEEVKSEPLTSLSFNITRSVDNLDNRIDELLDLARGDLGLLKINPEPIDLKETLSIIVSDLTPVAKLKQKVIKTNIPDTLPNILADRERLTEIMQNLITNAIKFTPKNGKIAISAYNHNNMIQVEVSDNGCGVNKIDLDNIFTPYYKRGNQNHLDNLGGLGIGLSLSKMLVELHGGRIWAESEKGKGCTMRFTLPINPPSN